MDKGILYTASESSVKMVSAGTGQNSKWTQTNAHCNWSTPAARGLFVYCASPYKLYALSTGDGSIAWQKPMNINCSVGTPYQLISARNYICVLNDNYDIIAHDTKTGSFTAAMVVNDNLLIAQFGSELYVFTPM